MSEELTFRAGGGAIYFQINDFMDVSDSKLKPFIGFTEFVNNSVSEGSGGAIFWEVPNNMIPSVSTPGASSNSRALMTHGPVSTSEQSTAAPGQG